MAQLPFRYTARNLFRRKTRTTLTIIGIASVVGAVVFMVAFSRSLSMSFRQTGDPDNIVIISKRAQTFVLSSITQNNATMIRNKFHDAAKPFLAAKGENKPPLISPEVYLGLNVDVAHAANVRDKESQRALIHGLDPKMAMAINSSVKLVEGRLPGKTYREIIVGGTAHTRIGVAKEDLAIGKYVIISGKKWRIVGRFEAPGTIMDCEIWAHVYTMQTQLKRQDTSYSFIKIKLKDSVDMAALCKQISTDEQFEVKAFPEQEYFADYAEGFDFFRAFAELLALIIIVGGLIAGMNTMYTSVLGRVREIGTLQVIGFSKRSVLIAIMTESLLLALISGAIGCCLGYFANGIPINIPMASFRVVVDFQVFAWAMGAAMFIGLGGAYVPAHRALKMRMVEAVRAQ